jgi:hypothetical protein
MRVKKSSRVKKAARVKKPAKTTRARETARVWPIALVVMIVATAALLAARRASRPADIVSADARPASIVTTDEQAMRGAASAPIAADTSGTETPAAATETATPVTITGCLERNQDEFRLKDTTGTDAPRARSWKSGFLKKSAASIHVVDAANRVKLTNHVGERVAVRGTLVDRQMHVRSLQRIAESCSKA